MSDAQTRFRLRPVAVPLRPLDKGMIGDLPAQALPAGAFKDIANFEVTRAGLRRRGTFSPAGGGGDLVPIVDQPLRYLLNLWTGTGDLRPILIGRKMTYEFDPQTGATLADWKYDGPGTGTVTGPSGVDYTLTDASADFTTAEVVAGDVLQIDGDFYDIIAVASATELTFQVRSTQSAPASGTYAVQKCMSMSAPQYHPDVVLIEGKAVIADHGKRGLLEYDSTNGFGEYNDAQTPLLTGIGTVTFFDNRLWIGSMTEGGIAERQRVRWTTKTNLVDFPENQYLDLPYTTTELLRLLPLGDMLIAYFGDAIYFGRITNIVNNPVVFTQMDTGAAGIIAPRAVCSWIDGHYFVSQHDIYFFSATTAIEPIGTQVVRETIENCPSPDAIKAIPDPVNERVMFVFPDVAEEFQRVWSFYLRTGAWSYDEVQGSFLTTTRPVDRLEYDRINEDTGVMQFDQFTENGIYRYSDMRATFGDRTLYMGFENRLYRYSEGGTADVWDNVNGRIESGDFDFDQPDMTKTVTKLSVKIDRILDDDETLQFTVSHSSDRGRTWRTERRPITIRPGEDEGKADIRQTGSLFRFRLQTGSAILPYTVTEVVLNVRMRGSEVRFGD